MINETRFALTRTHARLGVAVLVLAVAVVGMTDTSLAARAAHQTADTVFMTGDGPAGGTTTLIRTADGVSMNISTPVGGQLVDLFAGPLDVDWEVGDATTNWWVIFNNPGACSPGDDPLVPECGEDDVRAFFGGNNDPQIGLHFATGHVAGSATWKASASLREGDTSGLYFDSSPLLNAETAEVHVVVRSHGDPSNISPGERDDTIRTLFGGCDVNVCGDPQAAVFPPPA